MISESKSAIPMRTALYRHFSCEGSLLYVGISMSPLSRTESHVGSSDWVSGISNVTIEWHEDRGSALDAEAIAICLESPKHNANKNCDRLSRLLCLLTDKPDDGAIVGREETAFDIIEKIGRPRIKAGLEVDDRIIREWARRGRLPASWFDFCEKATGKKLDRSIFNFKGRT